MKAAISLLSYLIFLTFTVHLLEAGTFCKVRLQPKIFIHCCNLQSSKTESVHDCITKCHEYNAGVTPGQTECSKVNWNRLNEECSLLHDNPGEESALQSTSHPDYISAELYDCFRDIRYPYQMRRTTTASTKTPTSTDGSSNTPASAPSYTAISSAHSTGIGTRADLSSTTASAWPTTPEETGYPTTATSTSEIVNSSSTSLPTAAASPGFEDSVTTHSPSEQTEAFTDESSTATSTLDIGFLSTTTAQPENTTRADITAESTPEPEITTTPTPEASTPTAAFQSVGCGRQASNYRPYLAMRFNRIIGGITAKPHSWPWQVSLRRENGARHFCAGTILRVSDDQEESDIVLTAAHCIPFDSNGNLADFSDLTVVAGTHTRSSQNRAGEQRRKVKMIEYHSEYKNLVNDIAILLLERPIRFSDMIRPICLPQAKEEPPTERFCIASGWGRIETNASTTQDELKQAVTQVHSLQSCRQRWSWRDAHWDYAYLCAGPQDASSAICSGDSGGPLVCEYEDGHWVQHGIASFVKETSCAVENFPPIFARVSSYIDWIQEKIKSMSSLLNGETNIGVRHL